MADGYVSETVDIGDVEEGLAAMERRAHALGPAFAEVKALMKIDQRDHAKTRSGPEGPWQARAASTKEHHKRLSRNVLGKLPTAIAYRSSSLGAFAESRVKWSLAQQEGARVGRGARLPARPFLYMSDPFLDLAEIVIEGSMLNAYGGR